MDGWFQAFLDAIRNLLPSGEKMLRHFVVWFWDWMWEGLAAVLGTFSADAAAALNAAKVGVEAQLLAFEPWVAWADQWVPVIFGFDLFAVYLGLWLAFVPIKIVARHLPGIGG